jgi:hypothetical protein
LLAIKKGPRRGGPNSVWLMLVIGSKVEIDLLGDLIVRIEFDDS